MRATSSVGIALVMLVASLLSACGDANHGDRGATATATAGRTAPAAQPPASARESDRTLARRALIELADVPAGWHEQRPVPQLHCSVNPFAGARTIARSKRLQIDNTGVQETVGVFASPAASRRAFAIINGRVAMACLRRDSRRQMTAEAEGTASPLQLARAEPIGRWGRATRFTATAPSSIGVVSGSIDAVHVRAGRGLAALVIVSAFSPLRDDLYERVVNAFTRRLRAELG